MQKLGLYALGFIALIIGFVIYEGVDNPLEEAISEPSNTIQLGVNEQTFVALSETFARQLSAFGLEFGDFYTENNFIGIVSRESARIELLKNGVEYLTVFELQLDAEMTYEKVLQNLRRDKDIQSAIFGEDSFYFVEDGVTTNIVRLGDSVLAFRFDPKDFVEIRKFISSLVILSDE